MLLGVDVGGTFTDAVLITPEGAHTGKVPTTSEDQSIGVLRSVEKVLGMLGDGGLDSERDHPSVERFAHGMTVGTNALLERRGARTALIATEGFADVLDIARQSRPRLYYPLAARPSPLIGEDLKFEVAERCGPGGIVTELTDGEAKRVAEAVVGSGAESVAVCFLFSYLDSEHELAMKTRLNELAPELHVSTSSQVLAQFREYERWSTTVIDAYLAPLLNTYLERLAAAARDKGLPEPLIMRSSGGLLRTSDALGSGAWSVLSGPAGGALGAARAAQLDGGGQGLGLDMGGTSCDVCVIEDGKVLRTDSREVGGLAMQLPMVDIETVGAGGGSVAWVDPGGALRVGPRSAGADPGPACYGKGGTEPTVTDAHLLLGRLPREGSLSGEVELDAGAAREAMLKLTDRLEIPVEEVAHGVIRVANQGMIGAMRRITVERGLDPRDFPLIPFGGAGPLHAADIAADLEIDRIICPQASGSLSALGLCAAPERYDAARTVMLSGSSLDGEAVDEIVAELARTALGAEPNADHRVEVTHELRYRGQSFELPVAASEGTRTDPRGLMRAFEERHEWLYGHRNAGAAIELVTVRVAVVRPEPEAARDAPLGKLRPAPVAESSRPVHFAGGWSEAKIVTGEPEPGHRVEGPAVFELPGSTLIVPPGWKARASRNGAIVAEVSR